MKRLIAAMLGLLFLFSTASAFAVEKGFIVYNGDRESNRIAVTVDDCYSIKNLKAVLDICKEYNVPVTFFVVGKALKEEDREVWQDVIDTGCEIGNHTYGHASLIKCDNRQIIYQLQRTQQQLDTVLGYHYEMQVMRPPYGNTQRENGRSVCDAIEAAGYTHAIRWDVSQTNATKARKAVQNGSILLYHTNLKDVECLKELIPNLLEDGYELVTVSDLLGMDAPATSTDLFVYGQD
jgi:peptidoglycan-N-acetylglucosamine deacetylase